MATADRATSGNNSMAEKLFDEEKEANRGVILAQYSTDEQITEERNLEGTMKITNSQLQQYNDLPKEHIHVSTLDE